MIKEKFKNINRVFIERFIKNKPEREKIFNNEGLMNILSPGRVNIIGEHTDYNLGYSLPIAINKYKFLTAMRNCSDNVEVYDIGYDQYYEFSLNEIVFDNNVRWSNYIKGVLKEYIRNNSAVSGLSLVIDSNLVSGSGVSSSAALLSGIALSLERVFKFNNKKEYIMEYCHSAENNFIGINNGYLDHFAVLYGKKENALLLNFKEMSYKYVPLNLKDYIFLIIDSKEERYLPDTDYNKRREECSFALEKICHLTSSDKYKSLSDVDLSLLDNLKYKIEEKLYRRIKHVITENNRVLKIKGYLEKDKIEMIGTILFDSHRSLSMDYEVSTKKLDYIVNSCTKIDGVAGIRLMGAGFGGCLLSMVEKSKINFIIKSLENLYFNKFGLELSFIKCLSSDGCEQINLK